MMYNDTPIDPVLLELRALRSDVALLSRTVAAIAVNTTAIREAVLGLRDRIAAMERAQDRGLLTPLPLRAVSDSWVPDHGDGGMQP